ncbi:hypothetical protein CGCF413_v000926 [Colletotrichum fructicola]|nr:hypothetical protein CGCF413_v000926 [Colletotrichum fructicola]
MAANQKRRTRRQPQDGAHLDPLIQPQTPLPSCPGSFPPIHIHPTRAHNPLPYGILHAHIGDSISLPALSHSRRIASPTSSISLVKWNKIKRPLFLGKQGTDRSVSSKTTRFPHCSW